MTEITSDQLRGMIAAISTTIAASSDELNRLDSALGDGDHGMSLSTAFADAVAKIAVLEHLTPSDVLRLAGQSLMNRMGGASGALYGTLFTRSSAKVDGKNILTHMDVKELWQAALDGVIQRGKACHLLCSGIRSNPRIVNLNIRYFETFRHTAIQNKQFH